MRRPEDISVQSESVSPARRAGRTLGITALRYGGRVAENSPEGKAHAAARQRAIDEMSAGGLHSVRRFMTGWIEGWMAGHTDSD